MLIIRVKVLLIDYFLNFDYFVVKFLYMIIKFVMIINLLL